MQQALETIQQNLGADSRALADYGYATSKQSEFNRMAARSSQVLGGVKATLQGTSILRLTNKTALTTGDNSGIDLARAKRFVEEGAYVFIMGRRR
jgi:hypothetical protein